MSLSLLIIGLISIVLLIVLHEFGHFLMAKRSKVKVEEFGIFFPPRLWSRKTKGGYIFSINLLPIGGFVRMKGEHDSDKQEGSYGAASVSNKLKIVLAGVLTNIFIAFILFTIIALVGMPQMVTNQFTVKSNTKIVKDEVLINYVETNSPASSANIQLSDQLVSFRSGNKYAAVSSSAQLPSLTKEFAGDRVTITLIRSGHTVTTTSTFRTAAADETALKDNQPSGYLGISSSDYILQRSTWSAPVDAVGLMGQIISLTFKGIGNAIAGLFQHNYSKASSQVGGPVAIYYILKDNSLLGYQFIAWFVAYISLVLGVMNLLPIPVLDGGKVYYTLLPRLFRKGKAISKKAEDTLAICGAVFVIGLFILITIVDIRRHY